MALSGLAKSYNTMLVYVNLHYAMIFLKSMS